MYEIEQILGLAPDDLTRMNAETLLKPHRWYLVAASQVGDAWGVYQYDGKRTDVVWRSDNSHFCSCSASARPCRHALAIKLLTLKFPSLVVRRELSVDAVKLINKGDKKKKPC